MSNTITRYLTPSPNTRARPPQNPPTNQQPNDARRQSTSSPYGSFVAATNTRTGCDGFDEFMGKKWIYPNNMTVRSYQKQAVALGLFNNAMIVLPTGFGKTFIAAVVMYNFYRWYPCGKIIFVAPTRPLVRQQIDECKRISGIPANDCTELTGTIHQDKRHHLWHSKRVFFATPQVIQNDLQCELISPKAIKCIVIDEAHKAQGGYAYVEIVKMLQLGNRDGFRILALSATPGSNIERVKQVMINLFINEVMFRQETALDLMNYKNSKISKAWTVELTGMHKKIVERFVSIVDPIFKELHRAGLTYSCDTVERASKYILLMAKDRLVKNDVANVGSRKGKLMFYCQIGISLIHAFELLVIYGIRPFYWLVMNAYEEKKNLKTALFGNPLTDLILKDIQEMFGDNLEINPDVLPTKDLMLGHPKMMVVKDLLMKHFEAKKDIAETRAIVFVKYRDSVMDVVQALRVYDPILKVCPFVGQNGKGMTQKTQLNTMMEFKQGIHNVLVATCVAEEGLDIGEVDLIICYDTSVSPISNTQRRGRTGRKRAGDVHTLVTKNYEEKKLSKAGSTRRTVEDQLYNRDTYMICRYHNAPRMVPNGINPECFEQKIYPVDDEEEAPKTPKRKRRKKGEVVEENSDSIKKKKKNQAQHIDEDEIDQPEEQEPIDRPDEEQAKDQAEEDEEEWDDDFVINVVEPGVVPKNNSKQGIEDDEEEWDEDFWTQPSINSLPTI